jgi:hypothetical protein
MATTNSALWPADPNEVNFPPPKGERYLGTRLVVHVGITIAIALRTDAKGQRLAFDYTILNPQPKAEAAKAEREKGQSQRPKSSTGSARGIGDMLDAQGWSDSPLPLQFPNCIRVVGEAAVPEITFSTLDKAGLKTPRMDKVDPWPSTTLCLTDKVADFEVVSDGTCASTDHRAT